MPQNQKNQKNQKSQKIKKIIIMEGTKPIIINMEGAPPLRGEPYPTL